MSKDLIGKKVIMKGLFNFPKGTIVKSTKTFFNQQEFHLIKWGDSDKTEWIKHKDLTIL